MGDKFTFLTACEHFFSTECLTEMVREKILSGQVGDIKCPDSTCTKYLSDLDVKNLKLDKELQDKYE